MGRSSLVLLAVICFEFAYGAYLPPEVCSMYTQMGDVYLGGVFSLHRDGVSIKGKERGVPQRCKTRLPVSALQVAMAMVYAVKTINDNDNVLPNVTLGFVIHDDCSRDEYAMWGSLALLMGARGVIEGGSCKIPGMVAENKTQLIVGMVGTGQTSSSEIVSGAAGLFKRPLVSYGATSRELLNGEAFPYFFSTIASDNYKNQAILDILDYFQWHYVALVRASGYSTDDMVEDLGNRAIVRRVCMHVRVKVSEVPTENELRRMVNQLQENSYAKVVVLLASSAVTVNAVMSAALEADPTLNLTWLVSTALANDKIVESRLAQGSLFIEYDTPGLNEYEQYFRSLANRTTDNQWFDEFCGDLDRCLSSSMEGFSKKIPTLAPTVDAVYALAFALDGMMRLNCRSTVSECLASRGADALFAGMLREVSFRGTRGEFRFQEDIQSVSGHFIIKNMHAIDGTFKMVDVGSWRSGSSRAGARGTRSNKSLSIDESMIQWNRDLGGRTPKSLCVEECSPGKVKEALDKVCCWGCRACDANEIVNGTECLACRQAERPDDNRTICLELVPKTVTLSDPQAVLVISLMCLGLLLCSLSVFGMIKHRHHSLIKASSRELSCVNILGLVLGYLAVVPLLAPPGPQACGAAQVLYVLAFTLMNAPLLLKVNRIYRIFESSAKSAKSPKYTGPRAQLLIVALLVAVQALLIVITAVVVPNTWTSVRQLFPKPPTDHPPTLENFCQLHIGFLVASSYNVLLAIACCVYAFKARNVPGNYNEAKFYAASVYTALVLSLSAVPVYFYAETAVALAVSVSLVPIIIGYVTLFCVYLSKLYAVVFKKAGGGDARHQLVEKAEVSGGRLQLTTRNRPAFVSNTGSVTKVHPAPMPSELATNPLTE